MWIWGVFVDCELIPRPGSVPVPTLLLLEVPLSPPTPMLAVTGTGPDLSVFVAVVALLVCPVAVFVAASELPRVLVAALLWVAVLASTVAGAAC